MSEGEIRQAASMWALVAEMEAIKTEVQGMNYENAFRLRDNLAQAYSDIAFDKLTNDLFEIAKKLRNTI